MHLFTRTSTFDRARTQDALAFSVEIARYVSEATDLEVIPWAAVYGAPVGTVTWSARVHSQAAMGAAQEKLAADATYQAKVVEAASLFDGPMEDQIAEFVAVAGDGTDVGQYATIVTAQCALGRIGEATTWGVEILNHVSSVTGLDGSMLRGLYGPWATIAWISTAPTLEAVDAADAATSADAGYLERLDAGGPLFTPGSASQRLVRRLA